MSISRIPAARTSRLLRTFNRNESTLVSRSPDKPQPHHPNVTIQPQIRRSPTDILKALGSTIGKDYTAPHYRFHDDPYLIPNSNLTKRSFALSKESGRKAANWILNQHSDLFHHQDAQPPIHAFFPNALFNEDSPDLNESTLRSLILEGNVLDSSKVYGLLQDRNVELSRDTLQSLLELMAFYNETELIDEEWIEERWYNSLDRKDWKKNTWKDNGLAETIFKKLEPHDSKSYAAIICGRSKYMQVEKAWAAYRDAVSLGLELDIEVFNSLIQTVNYTKEGSQLRWQLVEELLQEIANHAIQPNLRTMNSILATLSGIGNTREAKGLALSTISEFRRLDIQPSLVSYYYLLIIFCKERGPTSTILHDILDELEGKELHIQDKKDINFFVTAMDICRNHLQDLELAKRLDKLLHVGNNYDLIGEAYKESVYYRHYMILRCHYESFKEFMEYYNKIVPNIYTPEPIVVEEILKSLEINQDYKFLPQIWSDMIIFEQTFRENLVSLVLQIMASMLEPEESTLQSSKLWESFYSVGNQIWEIIETQDPEKPKRIYWSGPMLGNLITIYVRSGNGDRGFEVLKKLMSSAQEVLGVPNIQSLSLLLNYGIQVDNGPLCLACVQYIHDAGYAEVTELATEVRRKVTLDSIQENKINNILGYSIDTISKDEI